ncbi:hypothetical protein TRAPUB_4312 [Trametes pubescens]|uniref:Uncharacterized protein n=1 Tax=Trametes pubescens TaxID=154538 RepID=A0A1M2W7C7_TRAPU|nr:hypothetical protein TRAPUB_4312 [Trametes pubescens]
MSGPESEEVCTSRAGRAQSRSRGRSWLPKITRYRPRRRQGWGRPAAWRQTRSNRQLYAARASSLTVKAGDSDAAFAHPGTGNTHRARGTQDRSCHMRIGRSGRAWGGAHGEIHRALAFDLFGDSKIAGGI